MNFSKRMGLEKVKPLQLESIDKDLLNSIWNGIQIYIIDDFYKSTNNILRSFLRVLWLKFYLEPLDEIPSIPKAIMTVRARFFTSSWHQVYDLIEFIISLEPQAPKNIRDFTSYLNQILEEQNSAYRLIQKKVTPISNELEINEIEEAIENTNKLTSLEHANTHLKEALSKLSDKQNPDYRNSVKESISAVEYVAKILSGNMNDSLGSALEKINEKEKIHGALVKGFKQIYGYTSDGDGIRHAIKDSDNCTYDEAKFMLIACSAFVNYLISKASKYDLPLN